MKKFWMCYIPHRGIPSKTHETIENAKLEAMRLCHKENAEVIILEAVRVIRKKEMPVEDVEI